MTNKKILIASGGTGGHVIPAYALAKYLKGKNYDVRMTTDKRGSRYLTECKDIELIKIHSSPLIRSSFLKFIISVLIIIYSIAKSFFFLISNRPSIIFGMGGYSSFPICIAATILRIDYVLYENNLIIGKANKFLLPFAKKIFVSYKELEGISEKNRNKLSEIGNIVREEILNFNVSKNNQVDSDMIKILVLGGSQAAEVFANILPEVFKKLKNSNSSLKIYQQCQKKQNDELSQFYNNAGIDFKLFNFTDKILNYYSKIDLAITRSGASVLGELININIPFISVPLPSSKDNHQYKNAKFYENRGCGYLVEEKDVKGKLYDLILSLYKDKSLIKNIISNQRQYSDKEIFRNLYNKIEELINEKN